MALINLRNALMAGKRLPYDAEVEYLESTGTQWIDTGVFGNLHTRIEIVIEKINNSEHYAVCGFFLSGSSAQITVPANYAADAGLYARFGDKYIANGMEVSIGKHTISSDRTGITVDGVLRGTFGATVDFTTPGILAIFRFKGLDRNFFIGRIFSCRVYDDGVLVRDYIPVRVGTVGYLYDRVSRKLFGNAGTGNFVLGPDVVPVEYIESYGTEYVDTGITADGDSVAEFAFAMTNTANALATIFGARSGWKNRAFTLFRDTSNSGCASFSVGVQGLTSTYPLTTTAWHTVRLGRQWAFDDHSGNFGVVGTFVTPTTLKLFGCHWRGDAGVQNAASMQCSYLRIYLNDTLVRSFRPVRVGTDATSWEGAMMDVLTRRIYRNAGTGAFTYGNDLKYPIPAE